MAEGILRHEWKTSYNELIIVSSMGIHGLENQEASSYAIDVCCENGVYISSHRSRSLVVEELRAADIIFSMEWLQKEYLHIFFPELDSKSFLLSLWSNIIPARKSKKDNIKDPYGGKEKDYAECFQTLRKHIFRILPALKELENNNS